MTAADSMLLLQPSGGGKSDRYTTSTIGAFGRIVEVESLGASSEGETCELSELAPVAVPPSRVSPLLHTTTSIGQPRGFSAACVEAVLDGGVD